MAKMDVTEVRALVNAEHNAAIGTANASKLATERTLAMDYYNGEMPDMEAPKGRSAAVSSDVQDTVEGLMPALMDIFASTEEVVRFEPVGPEDEAAAEQETDYVNHIFMQKNPGFLILYSFVKDALLQKNGIVKVFWEEKEKTERRDYRNVSDDAFTLIMAEPSIKVVAHSEHTDDDTGEPLHDVTVEVVEDHSQARVMGVPPEEFGISRLARSIRDASYCYHKVYRTQAALVDDGYDAEQIKELNEAQGLLSTEQMARDTVEQSWAGGGNAMNEDGRTLEIVEHYVLMDYDDSGPKIWKVVTGGPNGEVLNKDGEPDIELVQCMPFAAMTPVIVTHRFWGRSMADLVIDIQRIKTALLRGVLDNVYGANNNRTIVYESGASERTLDDLLTNRIGGVIRAKTPGAVEPMPWNPIGAAIMPVMEYVDSTREFRTGVSRNGQGLDANALQNQSATAVNQVFNAIQARTKLIARIFAETGIKDLFLLLHDTIRRNDRKANTVRLRNTWVQVDPRTWRMRDDMTVNVGLGDGSKGEQLVKLQGLINYQVQAIQAPQLGLVTPKELYNSMKKYVELAGFKTPDAYFTDPQNNPQTGQAPPDPEQSKLQAQMQIEQMKLQAGMQQKQQELQLKAQLDASKASQDAQLQGVQLQRQSQVEQAQAQADMATQQAKVQNEMALAQHRFELERQLKLMDAQIQMQAHRMNMAQSVMKARQGADAHGMKMQAMGAQASMKAGEAAEGANEPTNEAPDGDETMPDIKDPFSELAEAQKLLADAIQALSKAHAAPKRVVRDASGNVVGVEPA